MTEKKASNHAASKFIKKLNKISQQNISHLVVSKSRKLFQFPTGLKTRAYPTHATLSQYKMKIAFMEPFFEGHAPSVYVRVCSISKHCQERHYFSPSQYE